VRKRIKLNIIILPFKIIVVFNIKKMANSSTLPGKVQDASPGLIGFDIDETVTTSMANQLRSQGYAFCCRYLSLGDGEESGDLSNSEALTILNAGLALVAVQHVPDSGWEPTAELGTTYGTNAASNALSIGLPEGINIWCDLEGVASGTSAANVTDYCQAWYAAVFEAGYIPGLYVGANAILTGVQLNALSFQHYWKSMSTVPQIPVRGYQLFQGLTVSNNGLSVDPDMTQNDNLGGTVIWLSPA
jgi:hypothetical protein